MLLTIIFIKEEHFEKEDETFAKNIVYKKIVISKSRIILLVYL